MRRFEPRRRHARHPLERVGNGDLREALAHVARSLRSSQSLSSSLLASTARHPTDLTRDIARAMLNGTPMAEACDLVDHDESDRDVVTTLSVLSIAATTGGDVAATIDSLVATLDDRARDRAERRTQASTALASTRLITWLPVVCGGYLTLEHDDFRRTMFATTFGWTCLVVGVGLNVAGRRWTRTLLERSC